MKENKKKTQAYALRERTIELIEWAAVGDDCSRSEIVQDALDIYFNAIRNGGRRNGKQAGSAAEKSRTE